MNAADFVTAFKNLSAEDQDLVRAELSKPTGSKDACCPPSMKDQLAKMMKKMETSEDPMAMCHEMMKMCCEKVSAGCGS